MSCSDTNCPNLSNFILSRDQYIKNRNLINQNFNDSTLSVNLPNDLTACPNPTNYIQFYSKGFTGHTGTVGGTGPAYPDPTTYRNFVLGMENKDYTLIDNVCALNKKLVDPYCIFDTELFGLFKSSYPIPPPPDPTSPEAGANLVELYAMSLLRDIDIRGFQDPRQGAVGITTSSFVNGIISALNEPNIKNYMGAPLDASGNITLANMFRGNTVGDGIGPYISQFLIYNVPAGSLFYRQLYRSYSNEHLEYLYGNKFYPPNTDTTTDPNYKVTYPIDMFDTTSIFKYTYSNSPWVYYNDYMRTTSDFVKVWNGGNNTILTGSDYYPSTGGDPTTNPRYSTPVRYISTLRDGAFYVLRDPVWQPFFTAASILLGCPLYDFSSPVITSETKFGVPIGFHVDGRVGQKFVSLGQVDLFALLTAAAKNAMDACWLWKWSLMYLRPEEMAYQVNIKKKTGFGIDFSSNLMNSSILQDVSGCNNGDFLLPQAYINGSPNHPSYPSGHATYAGAMSTIIKAWFNCDSSMNAYVTDSIRNDISYGGDTEEPVQTKYYKDIPNAFLKIEHEIDKLASNCAILRNVAGVHYRFDASAGLYLGEQVAIKTLEDWVQNYRNNITFRFRLRNGQVYEISKTYSGIYTGPLPFYSTTPVTITNGPNASGIDVLKKATAPYAFINQKLTYDEQMFADINFS